MENLFNDHDTINIFKQIQYDLLNLPLNSGELEINNLISKIPPNILNSEDNLMVVCRLFGYYAKRNPSQNIKNTVKLYEKILEQVKTHLREKSAFFCKIFWDRLFFILWMHEEGLIPIEEIINSDMIYEDDEFTDVVEFFLPEIKEKMPELYEKTFKDETDEDIITDENINEIKQIRKKIINWIRTSHDYNDPLYREIETDQLRLSIKMDDVDTFQKILSNTNTEIDSTISESLFENINNDLMNQSLLSYAIEYGSIKIIKYLIMNNAEFDLRDAFKSIRQQNYEIIHLVESKIPDHFTKWSFLSSISCWNEEMIEYTNTNYPLKFLSYDDNTEFDEEDKENAHNMISYTMNSNNFIFLEDYLLPFLKKHPKYVKENIHEIIHSSLYDNTGYFLKELLKFPGINVSYTFESKNGFSLLIEAIKKRNEKAVEILLKLPNIDINIVDNRGDSAFLTAFDYHLSLKIVKMICENPYFCIQDEKNSCGVSNFYDIIMPSDSNTLDYLFYRFPELVDDPTVFSTSYDKLLSTFIVNLKVLLKHQLMKSTKEELIDEYMNQTGHDENDSTVLELIEILAGL